MTIATTDRPSSTKGDGKDLHFAAMPQADLSHHAITSKADNGVFQASQLQTRHDMADLSAKHGFTDSHKLLPADSAKAEASANKPAPLDSHANKPSDTTVAAAPSADKPADPVTTEGTHETYALHPVSTFGNDTIGSVDTPPTTIAANPVDTVDARPSVPPAGQPEQRPDKPPAPVNAPPAPRTDNFV